jgi:hypothetical protein
MIAPRESRLSREVVGGAQRHDAQRHVASVQAVHHLVERAVAPAGDHDVGAAVRGLGGERFRIAAVPGDAHVDGVPPVAHPRHHLAQVGPVRAAAVNDVGDVLAGRRHGPGEVGNGESALPPRWGRE